MHKGVVIDREEQQAMVERVQNVITGNATYEGMREELYNMGFSVKEDKPALAIWESPQFEIFVLIHMDPETGDLRDHEVKTFEEMEIE
jgi:hypothetical protein